MGIIANIRGALGLTGPQGPQGVIALGVYTWANNILTTAKANAAISVNSSTRVATFLVAGYYLTDWGSAAVFQAANSTVTLTKASHQIAGPM